MRIALLLCTVLLAGCWDTIPARPDWPASPNLGSCPELALVPAGTEKLSETLVVITKNYSEYHICKDRVESWAAWYLEQKKIYEESK
jgi:hypothetical protein